VTDAHTGEVIAENVVVADNNLVGLYMKILMFNLRLMQDFQ
jgi:uncharacterized protein (UPF0212 family)